MPSGHEKQGTEAEWRRLGYLSGRLRRRLMDVMSLATKVMPKQMARRLRSASRYFELWRSAAEDKMFESGGPQDIHIFYPSEDPDK